MRVQREGTIFFSRDLLQRANLTGQGGPDCCSGIYNARRICCCRPALVVTKSCNQGNVVTPWLSASFILFHGEIGGLLLRAGVGPPHRAHRRRRDRLAAGDRRATERAAAWSEQNVPWIALTASPRRPPTAPGAHSSLPRATP